jgi:hypothetical protein
VLRLLAITTLTVVGITSAMSQTADRHLNAAHTQALYRRSTYAHGYMHGYEDGFHNADIDIHMGRGERQISQIKEFRDCTDGYRPDFGDKKFFKLGYQQGFREGYSDSIRGVEFRAVAETRKIAEGINVNPPAKFSERDFDRAFSSGYDAGRDAATNGSKVEYPDTTNLCDSKMSRSEAQKQDYCDAFGRGYSLGFSDGQTSRAVRRTETAKSFQHR